MFGFSGYGVVVAGVAGVAGVGLAIVGATEITWLKLYSIVDDDTLDDAIVGCLRIHLHIDSAADQTVCLHHGQR